MHVHKQADAGAIAILIILLMSIVSSGMVFKTYKACVKCRPCVETFASLLNSM